MKNYCIIIPSFAGLGGAQLYAIRRAKYLIEKGFNVVFLVEEYEDSLLEKPESVSIIFNKYITVPVFFVSKRIQEERLKEFMATFENSSDLIIESFSWEPATWGEFFASKLRCKHFLYSLGEPFIDQYRYKYILRFLLFKYDRQEFIGISKPSLKIIFGRFFDEKRNYFVNVPFDEKEIQDITIPKFISTIDETSFVIATVSRLRKPYVLNLIECGINLSKKYPNKNFTLLICGDSSNIGYTAQDYIKKYITNTDVQLPQNLKLLFPGYTFPLGRDFFKRVNIFVGMGTAVVNSISQGCATICIDPRVNKSIGIFGLQTNSFAYTENGKYYSIDESLEDLFLNNDRLVLAQKMGAQLFLSDFENNSCMMKLDEHIKNLNPDKKYFSFQIINIIDIYYIFLLRITYILNKNRKLFLIYKKIYNS